MKKQTRSVKKTIAFYVAENIKTNQRFIYNQIVKIDKYRSIVIGPFDQTPDTKFPFDNYYNLNQIEDLQQFFIDENVIAVHAHHGGHGVKIVSICEEYNIPLIVSIRGRDGSARPEIYNQSVERYKPLIKHGALCIAVCKYLADGLVQLGFPEDQIHVLYGGIELDLFPYNPRKLPSEGEIRILSVGRLVEKKGFLTLIEAIHLLHKSYPNVKLHIIGTGKMEEDIKAKIAEYALEEVVILKGVMDAAQVSEELKQAHIFCLASQSSSTGDIEGIPNAIKEAMASGIPVVSTEHAGIPELIRHLYTGYLAPEKDPAGLARGFQFFLDHPEIWSDFTQRARQEVEENYDVKKQLILQQKIYSRIEKEGRATVRQE